jgi:subtilisin-like proprotein convertase family protein
MDMSYHLYDIHFPTPNYGWAVGMGGKILHTENQGADWEEQTNPVNTNFKSVCFCDHTEGWAVGLYGSIIHTDDGGRTWTEQGSGTNELLNAVHFTDCNNGWIVGDYGTVLHTSNGGETWGKQSSGTSNLLWSVYFADPAHGWISGEKGTILATKDGGGTTFFLIDSRYNLGLPIEDNKETIDTLTIFETGGKKSLQADSKVVAVEVIIDTVLHTAVSDLEFTLSHEGVTDTLIFHNGGENADFIDLVLSDASTMPIDSGMAPYSGIFMPHKPLSAFAGLKPTAPWVLKIYDAVEGNTGTLNAWSLKLYYEEATVSNVFEAKADPLLEGHKLYQNYPNPFHGQTYISYYLQKNCHVEINVFDFLGKKVATIFKTEQVAGKHQISWDASHCQGGIYIIQLKAGQCYLYKKAILVN